MLRTQSRCHHDGTAEVPPASRLEPRSLTLMYVLSMYTHVSSTESSRTQTVRSQIVRPRRAMGHTYVTYSCQ